jgi:CheY-like chemotaxis protein
MTQRDCTLREPLAGDGALRSQSDVAPTKPYVLLVEDDAALSEVVGTILQDEGYVVVRVRTVDRALDAITLRTPEVMVVDLLLDGGRSSEIVIERALKLPRAPAIILYSATPAEPRGRFTLWHRLRRQTLRSRAPPNTCRGSTHAP